MRVRFLVLFLSLGGCQGAPSEAQPKLEVPGHVISQGPCRVGIADVPVHVVWPSLSDEHRESRKVVSGANGSFTAELPDGSFDLVVLAPEGPFVFMGLSGADFKKSPQSLGARQLLVETGAMGPARVPVKTFTVNTDSEGCAGAAPQRAAFSVNAPRGSHTISLERMGTGPFTGTISQCPACLDCDSPSIIFPGAFDVETTDQCQVRIREWLRPTTNSLGLPLPTTLPEMSVSLEQRPSSTRSVLLPSSGQVKVKALTAFGTRELPVSMSGQFETYTTNLELSVWSLDGLATFSTFAAQEQPFELPAIPRAITPQEGFSELKPGTEFTWTRTARGVQLLTIEPTSGAGPTFRIFTDATSVTLPSFAAFGVTLSPAADYSWTVFNPGGSTVSLLLQNSLARFETLTETITGKRAIRTP